MFEGASATATVAGWFGIGIFVLGVLVSDVFIGVVLSTTAPLIWGPVVVWVAIFAVRVGLAPQKEWPTFVELMKWQIGIGAATAAIVVPAALTEGGDSLLQEKGVRMALFLVFTASLAGALGFALSREAALQAAAHDEQVQRDTERRLLARAIAAEMTQHDRALLHMASAVEHFEGSSSTGRTRTRRGLFCR